MEKALNLDIIQQQGFVDFFKSLPEKTPSTIRFFDRNEFYSVHEDDAALAAEVLRAETKHMNTQPKLSYVCINKGQFEIFLRKLLLEMQYRVEVYSKVSSNVNNWKVEYKGSPGNLSQFEEMLFENAAIDFTNSVMGVKLFPNKVLAIACINTTDMKFEVCEIIDNDSFSELESLIAQIGPKECIMPHGESPDMKTLKTLLERNGILVSRVKGSGFTDVDMTQDLNRLLYFLEDQQRNAYSFKETTLKNAMGCLNAVIGFLSLTEDEKYFNQFKISTLDAKRFVRIDNAVLYALHVLPKPSSSGMDIQAKQATNSSNLKELLDHCVTAQGRRLLEQWLKQPLKDYNSIMERLEVVDAILHNTDIRTQLVKDLLPRITDLIPLTKKISSKKAKLQDLYKIYQAVTVVPTVIQALQTLKNKYVKDMLTDPLMEVTSEIQLYQRMIEHTLDLNLVDRMEFLVKSHFDDTMTDLHSKKERLQEKMQRALAEVADDLGLDTKTGVKLESNDQLGFFFKVTKKNENILRRKKGYTMLGAIKGSCRFSNSTLKCLNDSYQSANEEYEEQQKRVVNEVIETANGYVDSFKTLNTLLGKVDVLTSFAVAAMNARVPYMKPKLHKEGSGILKLKQMRHPCLEAQQMSFIPNDVSFEKDGKRLYVITGPNMCGKSTYIRSVGIVVLMAHIGSLVPCTSAEISIVDAILVRIGAEDCQLKGISTFMLEMIETSTIMKTATANSLVIIDELGRGTSTYDGFGIAWAIAESLAKDIKSYSMFATHFHEINELADTENNVGNLHVSALISNEVMTPLYTVREGECDKSFGIHCARMAKFPEDVIQGAINYQKELECQNGMKYIKDLEPTLKRKIIAEGDEIIKNALDDLKSKSTWMTDEELNDAVDKMNEEVAKKNNLFVKGLMNL